MMDTITAHHHAIIRFFLSLVPILGFVYLGIAENITEKEKCSSLGYVFLLVFYQLASSSSSSSKASPTA